MSTEEEFARWLRRPEKTFLENLQFASKAWQSAEFTHSKKYEAVIAWLAEEGAIQCAKPKLLRCFPVEELSEVMQLRAQPGLVALSTKRAFVEMLLELATKYKADIDTKPRLIPDLLKLAIDWELLQDVFRADYDLLNRVYGTLLKRYEEYLMGQSIPQLGAETEFFTAVLTALGNNARRTGNVVAFETFYRTHALQPLVEVLLRLRNHGLCFFKEILALERLLCEQLETPVMVKRIMELPLHVRLLALECGIVCQRSDAAFISDLLRCVLMDAQAEGGTSPSLFLTVVAQTLEILRKHDVNLSNLIDETPIVVFLGQQLMAVVEKYKGSHLREILRLLCATLRLNPLILENCIIQVSVWMIVAPKSDDPKEHHLFDEFLTLLLGMFRRLSRAEKFLANLLRTLNEWLQKYSLPPQSAKGESAGFEASECTTGKRRKLEGNETEEMASTDSCPYLQILFKETDTVQLKESASKDFPELKHSWPSSSAGLAFSELVTSLVSKPSLVIWKSLLYSMKELLETLKDHDKLNENSSFFLDLHAAMLCEYLEGSRLAEQADKYVKEIEQQRKLSAHILGTFGRFLLSRDYQRRSLNAFLECCYHLANFELLLVYYRPDGTASDNSEALVEHLHSCLSPEEWTQLQDRVFSVGKKCSKSLYNRLLLQRCQAQALLFPGASLNAHTSLVNNVLAERKQLVQLLKTSNGPWWVSQLQHSQKADLAEAILENPELLGVCAHDLEALQLISLACYARLCQLLATNHKQALLANLKEHFSALDTDTHGVSQKIKRSVEVITIQATNYRLQNLPSEAIQNILEILRQMPLAHLRRPLKNLVFVLQLALYRDLVAAEETDLATQAFAILTDLQHFGQHVPIFKYLSTELVLRLLPVEHCWAFYELLFGTVRTEEKEAERFLTALTGILQEVQLGGEFTENHRKLLLLAIETLAGVTGPSAKRMRPHLDKILAVYADYVKAHFEQVPVEKTKKQKRFVEATLAGFAPYINALLTKPAASAGEGQHEISEETRKICKIYIGHSMDYQNPHAIRLMQVALNHRQQLHLDQDEVEFVLNGYWQQLNGDLRNHKDIPAKTLESAVKIIFANKTNEDLLLTLKDIGENSKDEANFANVARLLSLIAKCPLNTIKGAIFNEQFKQITCAIAMRLRRDEAQRLVDHEHILQLIAAQQALIENKMIPLSSDTLDGILAFLVDVNIAKFPLDDTNAKTFYALHLAITEACIALIKHRHVLLLDRVAQFVFLFKRLLQALVWYKSDRQSDTALSTDELEDLSTLALKVESLMHIIATHSVDVKRVAPFVLTYTIQLMVGDRRPTTLHPRIKTHVEAICYDLISVCDHRVGRFILRCSNEAARNVYETLLKDHNKYHKFKGKV